MLFLDYSSPFNTVPLNKLVAKLAGLGLPSSTCSWILNFLTERPEVVRVGNRVYTALTISTGTPQPKTVHTIHKWLFILFLQVLSYLQIFRWHINPGTHQVMRCTTGSWWTACSPWRGELPCFEPWQDRRANSGLPEESSPIQSWKTKLSNLILGSLKTLNLPTAALNKTF